MTNKRWKLKTNTVNSLLVLIVLILVKAGWTDGQTAEPRKLIGNPEWTLNNLVNNRNDVIQTDGDLDVLTNQTFHKYLNRWNGSQEIPSIVDEDYVRNLTVNPEEISVPGEDEFEDPQLYDSDLNSFYGESPADTLFHESTNNNSMILTDLSRCLYQFNFITCLKMLLLNRVNNMLHLIKRNNLTETDFYLLDGYVAFKRKNDTGAKAEEKKTAHAENKENDVSDEDDEKYLSLDQELSEKVIQLFMNRSLQITLLPGFGLDIRPVPKKRGDEFVCFATRTFIEPTFNRTAVFSQMRKAVSKDGGGGGGDKSKKKKKKGGGFNMMPMMIVPQMIMLGFLPFVLANIKMMVMNAFMINSMALNSAIFMTIRNIIFGPRGGPKIKYVNYGYKKHKVKSKKPTVIVHSPAAFVKQPEIHHHEVHKPEVYHEVHQPPKHASGPYPNFPDSGHYPNFPNVHESSEDVSGPYSSIGGNQYSSSELEESYDYDHSGPQGQPDEGQLNLSNIKYSDDNYGEFSNPKKRVVTKNRIIIRKTNANRRKSGNKPIRVKKRPKLPPEVKTIVNKLNKKKNDKKTIPYRNIVRKTTTTQSPISEEESEENASQDVQPTNLYHPLTNYYYPNQNVFDSSPATYNYPQIFKTTEKSNAWSVPEYASVRPSINPTKVLSTPVSYNYQDFGSSSFQEPDPPEYNLDILRLMPDVRKQIYQKPTEKNYLPPFSDHLSKIDYSNHGQRFNKNQIDRLYNPKNQDRNDHQISSDYRTVFSSKYNKDHVNFDNQKHPENRHQNHKYST